MPETVSLLFKRRTTKKGEFKREMHAIRKLSNLKRITTMLVGEVNEFSEITQEHKKCETI